ncbi:MAG: thioredoxin family protein [Prevotella sp.]|nr:thioredoxin family protein [Prevotella sp.]
MEIKVLGTGCPSCKTLFTTVQNAVAQLGIEATVVKEEDLMKIMSYNVLSLPALVIDEEVVAKGNIPTDKVKEILTLKTKRQ